MNALPRRHEIRNVFRVAGRSHFHLRLFGTFFVSLHGPPGEEEMDEVLT